MTHHPEWQSKTCETCRFSAILPDRSVCRRYPPMPVVTEFAWRGATYFEADRAQGVWPCTDKDDWCGEHQPTPPNAGAEND